MSDWRFGDVLEYPSDPLHGNYMFVVRKEPLRMSPTGGVEFWGFTGLKLPNTCPTSGYPECPYTHDGVGQLAPLGGHPEVKWIGTGFRLRDE